MRNINKITFTFFLVCFAFSTLSFAQNEKEKTKKVNFGYSANPPSKKKKKKDIAKNKPTKKTTSNKIEESEEQNTTKDKKESKKTDVVASNIKNAEKKYSKLNEAVYKEEDSISEEKESNAKKTREVVTKTNKASLSPTEYYKVGVGDVLYINLQDTTAKYYTVLIDGMIDYPLAGKLISVVDLTTDEIEDLLRQKVKLYKNPQIKVKVRQYVSHKFKVKGLARVGTHFLQREAMPLDVIKAIVGVKKDADKVIIERPNEDSKTIMLFEDDLNSILIQSGDTLTFQNDTDSSETVISDTKYYFLGERVCEGGKKKFHKGITLVQAVFEACGGLNKKLKEVQIIRKTAKGKFISVIYDFKKILNGNEEDPKLKPNDLINGTK